LRARYLWWLCKEQLQRCGGRVRAAQGAGGFAREQCERHRELVALQGSSASGTAAREQCSGERERGHGERGRGGGVRAGERRSGGERCYFVCFDTAVYLGPALGPCSPLQRLSNGSLTAF
jgi:hypothetical protein